MTIYLDYMATTPVAEPVVDAMQACLSYEGEFGNPASSTHVFGVRAKKLVEQARGQVASLINADPKEIVWTSGATESDNLAIKGACEFYKRRGKHIITMATEHKAVLDTCHYLSGQGYEITFLKPAPTGRLSLDDLRAAIRPDTVLVSIMYVNNETGVIQDISGIAEIVKSHGVLFHVDAAQANGKLPIDVSTCPIDLLSLSAHKIYGPKGIGALYVRSKPRVQLMAMIHGGQHEQGMRSGTLATHQIVGMGVAFELAQNQIQQDEAHAVQLMNQFVQEMEGTGMVRHGDAAYCVPYCINFSLPDIRSEALILSVPELAISSGSACNSATPLPSHVLTAMSIPAAVADCAVRLSIGRYTQSDDIKTAARQIRAAATRLHNIAAMAVA